MGAVKRKVKDKEVRHRKHTRARFGLTIKRQFGFSSHFFQVKEVHRLLLEVYVDLR